MEKLEPSYTAGGNLNCSATVENTLALTSKVKRRITICPSNYTATYRPKRIENLCPQKTTIWMYIAALFTIAPN